MKKIAMVVISLLVISCGSGASNTDEENSVLNHPLVGEWRSSCLHIGSVVGSFVSAPNVWLKLDLEILGSDFSQNMRVFDDSSCLEVSDVPSDIIPFSFNGVIQDVGFESSFEGYIYADYSIFTIENTERHMLIAIVDNIPYVVIHDIDTYVLTGESNYIVLFDWYFTKM